MSDVKKRTFRVPLDVVEDAESGAVFILPSEREMSEGKSTLEARLKEVEAEISAARNKVAKGQAEVRLTLLKGSLRDIERLREKISGFGDAITTRTYTMEIPCYEEYLLAENAARETDEATGETRTNDLLLMRELLPLSLGKTVSSLEPNVALHLWGKLKGALFPDASRLPFLSLPSKTP